MSSIALFTFAKPNGIHSGDFQGVGQYGAVPLNAVAHANDFASLDEGTHAIKLAGGGTYLVEADVNFFKTGKSQAFLRVEAGIYSRRTSGMSVVANKNSIVSATSHVADIYSVTEDTAVWLEARINNENRSNAFGPACGFGTEVYAQIKVTKL